MEESTFWRSGADMTTLTAPKPCMPIASTLFAGDRRAGERSPCSEKIGPPLLADFFLFPLHRIVEGVTFSLNSYGVKIAEQQQITVEWCQLKKRMGRCDIRARQRKDERGCVDSKFRVYFRLKIEKPEISCEKIRILDGSSIGVAWFRFFANGESQT